MPIPLLTMWIFFRHCEKTTATMRTSWESRQIAVCLADDMAVWVPNADEAERASVPGARCA